MTSLKALTITAAVLGTVAVASGQWSFRLDTSFRTSIVQRNVNSVLPLADGSLIASGIMRFPGEFGDKTLVRLITNGERDETFNNSGLGGGKLVSWQDRFYVGSYVRRVLSTGFVDPDFISLNSGPYFSSGQNADYHVYPDGRVLISGQHMLRDSVRGFVGTYNLIWFTNTGYLDTTRTHRQANGPIWEFKELADGKFICTCSCTQYEGQPVSRVFRVHPDGSLDTAFQSTITAGNIYEIEPLPDGRVLLGGNFRFSGTPQDSVRLTRLDPDGSRDASFASLPFAGNNAWWSPSGTIVFDIFPFHNGQFILAGQFISVDGLERNGLCMIDQDGQLLPAFSSAGVGPFTYQGFTNLAINNVYWNQDSTALYICGAFVGYADSTTNDPTQRFVSRLLVTELPTAIEEPLQRTVTPPAFGLYPNPTRNWVVLTYDQGNGTGSIEVKDLSGRLVASFRMWSASGQQIWDTSNLAQGTYTVHFLRGGVVQHTERIVIQ
jgi:uncharacterized delta-60 repeat protein